MGVLFLLMRNVFNLVSFFKFSILITCTLDSLNLLFNFVFIFDILYMFLIKQNLLLLYELCLFCVEIIGGSKYFLLLKLLCKLFLISKLLLISLLLVLLLFISGESDLIISKSSAKEILCFPPFLISLPK
jgi:hypothetical protein